MEPELNWDNQVEQSARTQTRNTDPVTGAQKDEKPEHYGLIPLGPLAGLARIYGHGTKKYAPRNWEAGYPWSWSYNALHRHLALWWDGQIIDAESGESHLLHAAWHCFTLWVFQKCALGTDDRSDLDTL